MSINTINNALTADLTKAVETNIQTAVQKNSDSSESTASTIAQRDVVDSVPELEYYNNYSKQGLLETNVKEPAAEEDPFQTEIDRLVDNLLDNQAFVEFTESRILARQRGLLDLNHYDLNGASGDVSYRERFPELFELGHALILAADQEQLKKLVWVGISTAQRTQTESDWKQIGGNYDVKDNYQDYDIKNILEYGNIYMRNSVYNAYEKILNLKARTEGLSEAEKLISPRVARIEEEYGINATFSNKLSSVAEMVNAQFEKAQKSLANEKFVITLDKNFTFNVTGGSADSATFLQTLLNDGGHELLTKFISTVRHHRREDGTVNSWNLTGTMYKEIGKICGVSTVSDEYEQALQNMLAAYNRHSLDQLIQRVCGFGLDDLVLRDGAITGKTDELTEKFNANAEKFRNAHYEDPVIKMLSSEPTEVDMSFLQMTFQDGKFAILYD